jgi:hypothetical protein
MKVELGNNLVFTPIKVAIGKQLQTIRVLQQVFREPLAELADIESGLYFLYARGIMPEETIHAAVDPETIAVPVKLAAD